MWEAVVWQFCDLPWLVLSQLCGLLNIYRLASLQYCRLVSYFGSGPFVLFLLLQLLVLSKERTSGGTWAQSTEAVASHGHPQKPLGWNLHKIITSEFSEREKLICAFFVQVLYVLTRSLVVLCPKEHCYREPNLEVKESQVYLWSCL